MPDELVPNVTATVEAGATETVPQVKAEVPTGQTVPTGTAVPRTFTQADLDRVVKERLDRADAKYRAQAGLAQRKYQDELRARQVQQAPEQVDATEARFRSHEDTIEELKLERDLSNLFAKYPEAKERQEEILHAALENKYGSLEDAWRFVRFGELSKVDPRAIETAAYERGKAEGLAAYLKSKHDSLVGIPKPEGAGGSLPSGNTKPQPKDSRGRWKAAEASAEEAIRQASRQ